MRLLNRLATNRALVEASYLLSRGETVLARLLPGTRRREERNRALREGFDPGGRVNGQLRGPVAVLPYGRYRMSYNGCEVLACYNALRLLGRPEPLGEVAAWFERQGIVLGGLWGSHALAVRDFFQDRGIEGRALYRRDAREFDAAFQTCPAAVFVFWNDAQRLRRGVHTVALSHAPGGRLAVDNLTGTDAAPCTAYRSIAELTARQGLLPVLLYTVGKKTT